MAKFYLKQRPFSWTDRYTIYSEQEHILYYVEGELFSFSGTMHLFNQHHTHLYTYSHRFWSFLRTVDIKDVYSEDTITIKKEFSFFIPQLVATYQDQTIEIVGNITAHQFNIQINHHIVAQVQKVWLTWGDTYEIETFDESAEDLLLALVIGIDTLVHNNRYKN